MTPFTPYCDSGHKAKYSESLALKAGEVLARDAHAFSYGDTPAQKCTNDPGKLALRVGDSGENTPLNADITLK